MLVSFMIRFRLSLVIAIALLFPKAVNAQVESDQVGAWYMYFWTTSFSDSKFGAQGDIQYRNWNVIGDLEQLLLRGGITWSANPTRNKFTLGYANITTGAFGDSDATVNESRVYQEALLFHSLLSKLFLTHRFRYEQRWVESQDFRTRFRYNIFINVPLNQDNLQKGAIYLAFYNELFINGQKDIGNNTEVDLFDRNRAYLALGKTLSDKLKVQAGYMVQTNINFSKGQIQLSLHHSI